MAENHQQEHAGQLLSCPMCRSALEPVDGGWICCSCLVRWHGDTFEPLEENTPDVPPFTDFCYGR
jgi:hypothetical protein